MTTGAVPRSVSDFDVADDEYVADPNKVFARLRAQRPIAYSARHGGYWLISRYDDVRDAARNTAVFSSRGGITIPSVNSPMPFLPIELDPPDHPQYRKPLQHWFSVGKLLALEDDIRTIVNEQLDAVVDGKQADVCSALAGPVPPIVIAKLLGLGKADWPMFRRMAEQMVQAAEEGDAAANAEALLWLFGYMTEQLALRKDGSGDDLLTFIAQMQISGQTISDQEAMSLALFMLIAGHETTTAALGWLLLHLARDADAQQRLRTDPALIGRAVEEVLRLDSPVPGLARTVALPVTLHGVDLCVGDRVLLSWASANRDAETFSEPEKLVIDRTNNGHVAFGSGIHRCLGANLARLEMRIVAEQVLRRIPTFRLDERTDVVISGVLARGPRSFGVRWD